MFTNSIRKYLIYILIFASLFLREIAIADGLSLGDVASFILMFVILFNGGLNILSCDVISRTTLGYIIILVVSSILNVTIFHTSFLNYLRIFGEGYLAYLAVILFVEDEDDLKRFSIVFVAYIIYFLIAARNILNSSYDSVSYYDMDFGRTNWGATNLLLIIAAMLFAYRSYLKKAFVIVLVLLLCYNVYFSVSRFAIYMTIAFFVFYRIWIGKVLSIKEIALYLSLLVLVPVALSIMDSMVDVSVLEQSREYLAEKVNNTSNEVYDLRVRDLNIIPIQEFIQSATILQFLIGTGDSVTHGIFSQTFIATGIIGFFYYLISQVAIFKDYYKSGKYGVFLCAILIIFFINDNNTNCRFEVARNTIINMILLGYLVQILKIDRYKQ